MSIIIQRFKEAFATPFPQSTITEVDSLEAPKIKCSDYDIETIRLNCLRAFCEHKPEEARRRIKRYFQGISSSGLLKKVHVSIISEGGLMHALSNSIKAPTYDHFFRPTFVGAAIFDNPQILNDPGLFESIVTASQGVIRLSHEEHKAISGSKHPWNPQLFQNNGIALFAHDKGVRGQEGYIPSWRDVTFTERSGDLSDIISPQVLSLMEQYA